MDVLAHALWTNFFFLKDRGHKRFWGVAMGIIPDLIVFIPAYIMALFSGNPFLWQTPPLWVATFYSLTHSLITFALVGILLGIFAKESIYIMIGWLVHIIIDVLSHKTLYTTQLLFPLTDFSIGVWDWGNSTFMVVNYGALAVIYIGLLLWKLTHRHSGLPATEVQPSVPALIPGWQTAIAAIPEEMPTPPQLSGNEDIHHLVHEARMRHEHHKAQEQAMSAMDAVNAIVSEKSGKNALARKKGKKQKAIAKAKKRKAR